MGLKTAIVKTKVEFHLESMLSVAEFESWTQQKIDNDACKLLDVTSRALIYGLLEFQVEKYLGDAVKRTNELLQAKGWRIRRRSFKSFFMSDRDEYRIERL